MLALSPHFPFRPWEAGNRIRTGDLLITSQLLYQLSYAGDVVG